jgi:uncharacterized protein YwgA
MWSIEFGKKGTLHLKFIQKSFSSFIPKVFIRSGEGNRLNMIDRKLKLLAFIKFLETECGFKFKVHSFSHRIRLQKYVFIAKFMGWPNEYDYNIYIRGPYSPDLAKDYYSLDISSAPSVRVEKLLPNLDKEGFTQTIHQKEIEWLEVATTMLSLYNNNKDKVQRENITNMLLERTKDIKSEYDSDGFIEKVFCDLTTHNLMNLT